MKEWMDIGQLTNNDSPTLCAWHVFLCSISMWYTSGLPHRMTPIDLSETPSSGAGPAPIRGAQNPVACVGLHRSASLDQPGTTGTSPEGVALLESWPL